MSTMPTYFPGANYGGYVGTTMPTQNQQLVPTMSQEQMNALSMQTFNRAQGMNVGVTPWEHIARYSTGTVIDLADSIWSTPLNPMGERGDIWAMTSPEQQQYYANNKGLIEGTSAIVGGLMTAVAAETLVIPKIASGLASSTALNGSKLWRAAAGWNESSRISMLAAQRAAAESGEALTMFGSKAGLNFMANRTLAGAATFTRTLPIEYSLFWNNDAFNSGDWAQEGFWIAGAAALGGAVGAVGGRALARQSANSAEIRDLRSQPLNMTGVVDDLLSDDYLERASRIQTERAELKQSALTTMYLLGNRSADPDGYATAAANVARLNSSRADMFKEAVDSTQMLINKGISGVKTFKGPLGSIQNTVAKEAKHLVNVTGKADPFVFHGLAEVGLPTVSLKQMREDRAGFIDSLKKQAEVADKKGNLKEAQRLGHLQRTLKLQEDFALVNGSWVRTDSELAEAAQAFSLDHARQAIKVVRGQESLKMPTTGGMIYLDANLTPLNAQGKAIRVDHMSMKERFTLSEMGNQMVKTLKRKDAKTKFTLDESNSKHWFTLDLASEIVDQGGTIQFKKWPNGIDNIEDVKREALRLKAQAALNEAGPSGRITPELRFKYNLPQATALEMIEDSAGDNFRVWLETAAGPKNTAAEMSEALSNMRTIQGVDIMPPKDQPYARVDGNMFGFNRDANGNWLSPMVGYFDQRSTIQKISQKGHSAAATLYKAERTGILVQAKNHIGDLTRKFFQMPQVRQAMNITGLANDQMTGLGGGFAQAAGELLPKTFLSRDIPEILAGKFVQEETERHARVVYDDVIKATGMQDFITTLTTSGHAAQRAMVDQYFSLRPGWDISGIVPVDGKWGFKLKDTVANRERLGMDKKFQFGERLMSNDHGAPIVVDDLGKAVIDSFQKITDLLIDGDNTLRRSHGLKDVERKQFFAPVPDTKNKFIGFVYGPDQKLIRGQTIVANSQAEYNKMYAKVHEAYGPDSGITIRSKGHLSRMRDIYDEAEMDWIDPGVSAATGNLGGQKGGLTGAYTRQGAFTDALDWVKRKIAAQSQDTLRNVMHEPLMIARQRSIAENALTASPTPKRNVFDVYEQMLTGRSVAYEQSSLVDGSIRQLERKLDSMLANSAITVPARYITDLATRFGMNPLDLSGKKTYRQISDELGKYSPFKNVTDYLDSRGVRQPPTIKGMATKLNSLAASVYLRWFEMPHAIMNGLGLMATMPSAIIGAKAPVSTFVDVSGKSIGIMDGLGVTNRAMKRMFHRGANADWEHMKRNGDATQSAIEYHQQLGAIQSQAGFMKWARELDKWASYMSETSESMSRQVAHFVGLEMADLHRIQGMEARHNFAREVANSMIADYSPVNKPELFGSGFGSLIGLFQSYALNHYTKMFRWMENGDYGKVGIQAAMQATMFGVPSTYGFGYAMNLRDQMTASGSEPTALDMIYSRFGPVLGGAIAHGGVSELTGLGLWTRGDMSPRLPGSGGSLPAIDIGVKVANGFMDGVKAYLNTMPGEGNHAFLEAVQRNMPNRILRSWLILANEGQEVDAYGRVMSETYTFMDTVARTLGIRSSRQQAELEAFYSGKSAMERDASKMEFLRESFRSAVRRADGNVQEVNPIQYFNDYVAAGGNPRAFKTWVKNLMRDSDSARSVEVLRNSMSTSRSALEAWRFGAYGAWAVE